MEDIPMWQFPEWMDKYLVDVPSFKYLLEVAKAFNDLDKGKKDLILEIERIMNTQCFSSEQAASQGFDPDTYLIFKYCVETLENLHNKNLLP
jgi:hypothetical protein